MKIRLSDDHKKRINVIISTIRLIPCNESSFIRLENLFYDVLTIARTYGSDIQENNLLAGLKHIQDNEYKHTQEKFPKSRQREVVIKKFQVAVRKELSNWISSCYNPSPKQPGKYI